VCLFFRAVSQKPTQLGSPDLTIQNKCSMMSPVNPFILEIKGQRSTVKVTSHIHNTDMGLCTHLFILEKYLNY